MSNSVVNHMAVDEKLRKDILDAKVVRRMPEGSDQYAVLVKIKEEICSCECDRRNGKGKRNRCLLVKGWTGKRLERRLRGKFVRKVRMMAGEGTYVNVVLNCMERFINCSNSISSVI